MASSFLPLYGLILFSWYKTHTFYKTHTYVEWYNCKKPVVMLNFYYQFLKFISVHVFLPPHLRVEYLSIFSPVTSSALCAGGVLRRSPGFSEKPVEGVGMTLNFVIQGSGTWMSKLRCESPTCIRSFIHSFNRYLLRTSQMQLCVLRIQETHRELCPHGADILSSGEN